MSAAVPPRALSQWLQLMLAEIAAKRDAQERARAEEERRRAECDAADRGDTGDQVTRS